MMVAITIVLLAGVVTSVWRRPASRQTMLFGALFSLPLVAVELLLTGGIDRLGSTAGQQTVTLLTTILSMASIGALSTLLTDRAVSRWWGAHAHPARHRLWWFAAGMSVSAVLFLVGQPAPVALMIGLAINALLVITIERQLIWDAVISSFGFAILFVGIDILVGIRASGDIARLLIGPTAIGLTIFGLPLERLLTMGLLGALIGPLFSATKFRRSPNIAQQSAAPLSKVVVVAAIIILVTASSAWAAPIYILPPSIQTIEPAVHAKDVPVTAALVLVFNRPIERQALTLDMTPAIDGAWTFEAPRSGDHGYRRARYTFSSDLPPATTFQVRVSGIQSTWRLPAQEYSFQFTTTSAPVPVVPPVVTPPIQSPPVPVPVVPVTPPLTPTPAPTPPPTPAAATKHILSVSEDYQDQALSCEAAALKMALAGQGIKVSESEIMKYVGYDPTPHRADVWGDPNVGFVGNIAGHQDTTGYGVYWGPISKAANHWRPAHVITNGTVKQLAAEIYADHTVVIWGTLGNAYRDDWKTPSGKNIVSWHGEHARTLIGVNGPADNPTSFIINDPVVGRVTWSADKLDANWSSFNRSAVIVE